MSTKEHPIIMSAESVRAILDGQKTQTRRVIKPQPVPTLEKICLVSDRWEIGQEGYVPADQRNTWQCNTVIKCPYGKVGDRLWVRETWDFRAMKGACAVNRIVIIGYEADDTAKAVHVPLGYNPVVHRKKRSSIHMPKWAARIWLEITNVRVERIKDIDENDACAEGCELYTPETNLGPERTFQRLWDSINKKRGFGWEVNPWVWVVEFKRVESKAAAVADEVKIPGPKAAR